MWVLKCQLFLSLLSNFVLLSHSSPLEPWTDDSTACNGSSTTVSSTAADAGPPVLEAFVSFSIEFAFFPDFAGNASAPNNFSNNLLDNIGAFVGTKPWVRVGGNTQDYALFNASLDVATNGTYNYNKSKDYPTTLYIGPSFFDSYNTWPNTKFIHGFNLAKNGSAARESLLATVPIVCKILECGKLAAWQLGNEPDLYATSAQGPFRPANWSSTEYVAEWLNGTHAIRDTMAQNCPNLVMNGTYEYYAPSFAGTSNNLDPVTTWADGLNTDHDITYIDSHNYIDGATSPGVTLQGTLMNHSSNVASIVKQLNESNHLSYLGLPFILGETNSLYNEGAPGLSNSFGAALWGVDFNLWCASQGIGRTHMHQGTNYRYASWQPITTDKAVKGTKPPYYGNIAVAAMLANSSAGDSVQVENLPLPETYEAAYAAYTNGSLSRVMVINMLEYNYTNSDNTTNTMPRPMVQYNFTVPATCAGMATVQRLNANGSDAITGVTFNGVSYNYELNQGLPVNLANTTADECVTVSPDGQLNVTLPQSSAALVQLSCS